MSNKRKLTDYIGGWLIGNFNPSIVKTKDCEVAVKFVKAGTIGDNHYHKKSDEYTVILSGRAIDNEIEYIQGDIIEIKRNMKNKTIFVDDSIILSIKTDTDTNDKFY